MLSYDYTFFKRLENVKIGEFVDLFGRMYRRVSENDFMRVLNGKYYRACDLNRVNQLQIVSIHGDISFFYSANDMIKLTVKEWKYRLEVEDHFVQNYPYRYDEHLAFISAEQLQRFNQSLNTVEEPAELSFKTPSGIEGKIIVTPEEGNENNAVYYTLTIKLKSKDVWRVILRNAPFSMIKARKELTRLLM